jgi:hypothetical protein
MRAFDPSLGACHSMEPAGYRARAGRALVSMAIRAVVFDIGGVLEITPDLGVTELWETRLRLPAGEIHATSVARLEPDEPVETVAVDDLAVGCAPRPRLQVVHDPATFAETGEPVAQSRGSGRAKQGQHHAFGLE